MVDVFGITKSIVTYVRGVLISEVVYTPLYVGGSVESVLIRGVLISEVLKRAVLSSLV